MLEQVGVTGRYGAFLAHLGISLAIFGVLTYLVVEVWYPDFFFYTDGGWQGLRLLLGVDLVLGPLLTLIVYRTGKPGLRFDLSVIALVQAACLLIGVWIVHDQRPLAIAYVDGSFYSVCAQSFREVDAPVPDLSAFPGPYPKWVTVALPNDLDEQSAIRSEMLRTGRMLSTLADRYTPFKPSDVDPKEASSSEEIIDRDRFTHAVPRWTQAHAKMDHYRYFRFGARYVAEYVGFDGATGTFAGILETPSPR